jgi:hypothetical protein
MKSRSLYHLVWSLAALWVLGSPEANAQFFSYTASGDVLAGFRKTGQHQGNYELVVNLGNVTNFIKMAPGSAIPISEFSPAQLAAAFPDGFSNLQWSVFSTFSGVTPWVTPLGSFPGATIWYTLPRTNSDTQSTPYPRLVAGSQFSVKPYMLGIGQNAIAISMGLGTTNDNNNSVLVREPILGNESRNLSAGISDPLNSSIGNFGGTLPFNVENTTPDAFTSLTRSDFYQSVPTSTGGSRPVTYIDPITGLTNGPAYFVGSFQLNPDGTMTFTRASTNSPPPPPPPPQLMSVTRVADSTTITFTTTNGATYALHFTNSAGLDSPVTTWSTSPTTIIGNGGTGSLSDSSSDAERFYRVSAHF